MVSVLRKELEYKMEKLKNKKVGGHAADRLFTVPYFFVRSFRYTAPYRHDYCTEGGGEKNRGSACSQTAPPPPK